MDRRGRRSVGALGAMLALVVVVGAFAAVSSHGTRHATVAQLAGDRSLLGSRLGVSAYIVPSSPRRTADKLSFLIADEQDGPRVQVVVERGIPDEEIGLDGRAVFVVGVLDDAGVLHATELVLRGPEKRGTSQTISADKLAGVWGGELPPSVEDQEVVLGGSMDPSGTFDASGMAAVD